MGWKDEFSDLLVPVKKKRKKKRVQSDVTQSQAPVLDDNPLDSVLVPAQDASASFVKSDDGFLFLDDLDNSFSSFDVLSTPSGSRSNDATVSDVELPSGGDDASSDFNDDFNFNLPEPDSVVEEPQVSPVHEPVVPDVPVAGPEDASEFDISIPDFPDDIPEVSQATNDDDTSSSLLDSFIHQAEQDAAKPSARTDLLDISIPDDLKVSLPDISVQDASVVSKKPLMDRYVPSPKTLVFEEDVVDDTSVVASAESVVSAADTVVSSDVSDVQQPVVKDDVLSRSDSSPAAASVQSGVDAVIVSSAVDEFSSVSPSADVSSSVPVMDTSVVSDPVASKKPVDGMVYPIESVHEIKWVPRGIDLSGVPEPMYRIALHLSEMTKSKASNNGKDWFIWKVPCGMFYNKERVIKDEDGNVKDTLGVFYDYSRDVNVLNYACRIEEKHIYDAKYNNVLYFRADKRKDDGFVHSSYDFTPCLKKDQPWCYFAQKCGYCLPYIVAYITYLRETNPDEIERQRKKYNENPFPTYALLEPLPFSINENLMSKAEISSESLRFAKRLIDEGLIIPLGYETKGPKTGNPLYDVCMGYPECLRVLFNDDYNGNFSESVIDELIKDKNVIPYRFSSSLYFPIDAFDRDDLFLDYFLGKKLDNVNLLICLITFVYGLLQSGKYLAYYDSRVAFESTALSDVAKDFVLADGIHGFYGTIAGSDAKAVCTKADNLASALQSKCSNLRPMVRHISLTDFMESLVEEARDGMGDTLGVKFLEPQSNMVYVLDGISLWMKYYNKYSDVSASLYNRTRMLYHVLDIFREYRPDCYFILTGTQEEIDRFMSLDKVYRTLFGDHMVELKDDTPEQLYQRFVKLMQGSDMYIAKNAFIDYVTRNMGYFPFKNESLATYLSDYVKIAHKLPADFNTRENQSFHDALDKMVGLDTVKAQMSVFYKYVNFQQQAAEFGIKLPASNFHMVFTGNPGTGKTTVARIVAKILYSCGVCKQDKFIEIQAADLIAKYLGQTSDKTKEVVEQALGGVLFIDEAYAITDSEVGGGNDYGKEALAVLIKMMEDNKDRLVVIFAGYKENMKKFIDTNPGMQSRIGYLFDFEDYDDAMLVEIFRRKMISFGFTLEDGVLDAVKTLMEGISKEQNFGNGRFVDKFMQEVIHLHAVNLTGIDGIDKITLEDLPDKERLYATILGRPKKDTQYDGDGIGFLKS